MEEPGVSKLVAVNLGGGRNRGEKLGRAEIVTQPAPSA
jgi:hypothetical protein